jgi:putative hydrolases of HD superfamily
VWLIRGRAAYVRAVSTEERQALIIERTRQPDGVPERLAAQIGFLLEIDRMKTVLRRNPLVAAPRRENDAEHSWHLAMMALVLAEYAEQPVDTARVVELVLVHDLVEVYAGDTWIYDDAAVAGQAEREQRAADRLFPLLPGDQARRVREAWDEFEARQTPEARFAKALDRLQPMLLNFNTDGGTWRGPGVDADAVVRRTSVIADGSSTLWDYARSLLAQATARGDLAPGASGSGGNPEDPAGGNPEEPAGGNPEEPAGGNPEDRTR